MEKVFITDKQGNKVLPKTHVSAVYDDEGNDLGSHLGAFEDEVRGLVDTPHQEYVTVATYSALPASGSEDTIYRVSSWDGSANSGAGAVDVTVYSEYAWNGSDYAFLCVKSQIDEVFDITVYNSNTKYADLSAALGVNGVNIPESLRKGGMSVKYVQSSDNKYVRYNLLANSFTTDTTQWAIAYEGVYVENPEWIYVLLDAEKRILAGLKSDGSVEWSIGVPTPVRDYVSGKVEKIVNGSETTSIDGLNKIIAFLADFSTSDTLKSLLDGKVDAEVGKSLINSNVAESIDYITSPEYIDIKVDDDGRLIESLKPDGSKYFHTKTNFEEGVKIDNGKDGGIIVDKNGDRMLLSDSTGQTIISASDKGVYVSSLILPGPNGINYQIGIMIQNNKPVLKIFEL